MPKYFKVILMVLLMTVICNQSIIANPFDIDPNAGYIMVDGVRGYATINNSTNVAILICTVLFLIFCILDKEMKLKKLAFNAIFIIIWCIEMILISDKVNMYIYVIPYYTVFLRLLSIVAGMVIFIKIFAFFINIYKYKKGKEIEIEKYKEKMFKIFLIFSVPIIQRLSFNFGRTGWGGSYKIGEKIGPEYNPMIDTTLIIATLIPFVVVIICKLIFNIFQKNSNTSIIQSSESEE